MAAEDALSTAPPGLGRRSSRHEAEISLVEIRTPRMMEARPQAEPEDQDNEDIYTLPKGVSWRLYLSHFLSTWNSRLFEFGAVLFLEAIFPGTLLPMSAYALSRSAAAMLFSSAVGRYIDAGDRLRVIKTSIFGQRAAIVASCAIFFLMVIIPMNNKAKRANLAIVILLACVEKLCAVMNLVSMERDWVVVVSNEHERTLQVLNSRMRRIDLFCKLVGPLLISLISAASTRVAILLTLGLNILSLPFEYFTLSRVYKLVPQLSQRQSATAPSEQAGYTAPTFLQRTRRELSEWLRTAKEGLPYYVKHSAFMPSFSLSLLYLTVLSFSGQMITYLLSIGYSALHVGIARTVSTIFEMSATWIAPRVMKRIGPVRAGIWFLMWQMVWLAGAVGMFWGARDRGMVVSASGLVGGVILSRVGLWGFDLSAQIIIQNEVEYDHRGDFSTTEAAFQNLFELLSYASTMIFSRPDQFQWPVVISVVAVYCAGGLYTAYVRKKRGHLLHNHCIHPKE